MTRRPAVGQRTETVSIDLATATAALRPRPQAPRPVLVLSHLEEAQLVALDDPVTVGRDATADVVVDDRSLSREHARFERRGDAIVVVDLGSTNGIWVAGRRVEGEAVVPADAEVTMGRVLASVRELQVEPRQRRFLEDHERFRQALAAEVQRARFFRRQVTLVHLRLLGAPQTPRRRWYADVQARLRPVDRLAAYSADTLAALLPEASIDELAGRLVEMREAIGEGLPGAQLVAGAATYPASAASPEELRHQARDALLQAHGDDPFRLAHVPPRRTFSASTAASSALGFVAQSDAMTRLVQYASRVAKSTLPILLLGERGAGKETVARLVHERSDRAAQPLVAVRCGAIAPSLQASYLFGHCAGAFEGAADDTPGLLREADGQTVFLDDVDELALPAQVGLLRLLEEQTVLPLGAQRPEPVDLRVLCASSRPLDALADEGAFSRDLLARLETLVLVVPPLRDRVADIVPLAERLLEEQGGAPRTLAPGAQRLLERHPWPANLHELRNVLERAAALGRGPTITADQLPLTLAPEVDEEVGVDLRERVEALEIELLEEALGATGGEPARAAAWLRLPLRTFLDKLKHHGLRLPRRRR